MAGPVLQYKLMLAGFKATDAQAVEDQMQTALQEQAILQLLDLQIVLQGVADLDDLVMWINVQVLDGQAPLESDIMRLQMAQIHYQRHNPPP
jgi:hypothetical protein